MSVRVSVCARAHMSMCENLSGQMLRTWVRLSLWGSAWDRGRGAPGYAGQAGREAAPGVSSRSHGCGDARDLPLLPSSYIETSQPSLSPRESQCGVPPPVRNSPCLHRWPRACCGPHDGIHFLQVLRVSHITEQSQHLPLRQGGAELGTRRAGGNVPGPAAVLASLSQFPLL